MVRRVARRPPGALNKQGKGPLRGSAGQPPMAEAGR